LRRRGGGCTTPAVTVALKDRYTCAGVAVDVDAVVVVAAIPVIDAADAVVAATATIPVATDAVVAAAATVPTRRERPRRSRHCRRIPSTSRHDDYVCNSARLCRCSRRIV
jgi:hypothetical protein